MKKITFSLILTFCAIFFAQSQEERLATGIRDVQTSQIQRNQSRALTTIYETNHLGANGAEITAAANGPNTSMADAIVLAGTNRILQTVTVDVFNLTSAAPYNLTLRIYTDCTTNGASGACGSGPGTLIAASSVTQTVTPGPLGFIYSVVFTLPNVNLYSEVDNTISVSLNASRSDVFWILNEAAVIGSQPAGDPPTGVVQRCGSAIANNGCARAFGGVLNNFSLKLEAEATPPNDLCANAITIAGDGTISGTTVFATIDSGNPFCGTSISSPGVWYKFTDSSITGSAVTLSLCGGAAFDTKISVYTGSCGAFTCVTGNDDFCGLQSQVIFNTDGSSTYYVLVHSFGGATGPFDLNVSGFPIAVIGNPPTIACPADITLNNTPGTCGTVANFAGVAFDIEDGNISSSIVATPASGSTFAVGVTNVTLSVTDSDGNTSTCNFDVTVLDNELPVAVCQDITVDLDPVTGMATITAADVDNGSNDNCGIASMSLDVSSFDCSMTGANTVVLTVTDNSGNSSTCTSTVTVQDVTAPEVFCVGGFGVFTESEDFEGASLPSGWSTVIEAGSQDWTFGSGIMPGGAAFPTNAAIFDDDAAGNGQVNLARLLSPVYDLTSASNVQLSFDYSVQDFIGFGTFEVEVWDGAAWQQILFVDNTDQAPINSGDIDVSAFANPAFQVRYTYDDEGDWAWGAGVDNFLLSYEAASGGGLDVYLDANGMASIDPNDLVTGVNEACGYTITAGGAGGGTMGSLSTLFASNNGGNPGGAVYFDITVGPSDLEVTDIDVNTAEAGSFTMDIYTLVGTYVGNEANPGAWGAAAANASGTGAGVDTPSNAVLASSITLTANTTYGMALVLDGTHAHAYTNGDGSNQNFSNADMSMALGAASNVPFTTPIFAPRVFNGAIHYTTSGGSGLDFTCADLGENIVEVTVTDDSGNSSTCMAVVNVIDNIAPILVCQNATIELGPDGTATVDPMALLASLPTTYEVMVIGSDNSSGFEGFTDFTVSVTEAAAVTFDWDYTTNDDPGFDSFGYLLNGTYTQLTNPGLGNQSGSAAVAVAPGDVFGFRSQTDDNLLGNNETVISNFMPGFEGQFDPANWNLTLTDSDGDAFFTEIPGGPLSFDACGITILAVDVPTVSCADIGTPITVTVFASDASGNIAACTSVITVVDLLAPVLTCPADQTVDPGAGNLFYILPDYIATGEATAIDNCTDPVTLTTQVPAPGTPLSDGTYTITMTATDEYGNTS
ncbi:HYR domain-containing protein, partial [Aequorivita antarctica]